MKKKLLSILLTMCMLFSFLHITTFANTSGITVYVKSPLGKSTQITASGDTTIKDIKDKIAKDFEITLDDTYRLCCPELSKSSDRKLPDENKTLSEYNFQSGYTIYLEKSSWVSTAENPVTVMGLTISGGTGAQEPYGNYSSADYYWNYTLKTLVIRKAAKATEITISGKADDEVSIVINGSGWNYITLNNVTLNSKGRACITVNWASKLDLTLKGTNFLTSNEKFENGNNNKAPAIELCNSGSQLRTKGDNTATLTATSNCEGMPGIGTEDEEAEVLGILINGGNVIANGGKNAPGIRTNYLYVGDGTVTANPGSGSNVGVLVYNTGKVTKVDEGRFMVTPNTKAVVSGTVSATEIRNNGTLTFSTYDNLSSSNAVYSHEYSTRGKVYVKTDKYIYSTSQSKWVLPDYTVKFNTDGGNTLNDKTVKWTDEVLNGIENPTKPGWIFKGWKYEDTKVTANTTYKELVTDDTVMSITLTAQWQQGPANTLRLNGNGGLTKNDSEISDYYTNALTINAKNNDFIKSGYTFTEWNTKADKTGNSYKVGDTVSFEVAHNGEVFVLYAIWTENSNYTVNFDTDGGSTVNDKTNVKWTDKVLNGIENPTKTGWEFKGWKCEDTDVTANTTYKELVTDDAVMSITLTAQWKDVTAPVISGIENGKTYCSAQMVNISDNDGIANVTVNETPVELQDGTFTLTSDEGEQKIIVTDNSGNTTEMTVTVNDGHTGGTATCTDKAKCDVCGEEYGGVNTNNHTSLTHINAKAATTDAEGNTEYWYCENCKKYFSDKDSKTEIKLADTVIAKLTKTDDTTSVDDKSETSPKTGVFENFAIPFMLVVLLYTILQLTVIKKIKTH